MKNQLLQETAAGLAMATAFTDGDKKLARTLPQSCDINIEDYEDGDDLDDEIADALSDLTGFCVEGFNYTIKNNK